MRSGWTPRPRPTASCRCWRRRDTPPRPPVRWPRRCCTTACPGRWMIIAAPWPGCRRPCAMPCPAPGANPRPIPPAATAPCALPRHGGGMCWSPCNPNGAIPPAGATPTTTCPAPPGTAMWPSTCGCGRRGCMPRSTWARMALWNGCPARPSPCRQPAGPRRWRAPCPSSIPSSSTIRARPRRPSAASAPSRWATCRRRWWTATCPPDLPISNGCWTNIPPPTGWIRPGAAA